MLGNLPFYPLHHPPCFLPTFALFQYLPSDFFPAFKIYQICQFVWLLASAEHKWQRVATGNPTENTLQRIMCVKDAEEAGEEVQSLCLCNQNVTPLPFQTQILSAQMENHSPTSSVPLERICEDRAVVPNEQQIISAEFLPVLRSGEWSHIGRRPYMEDTHICISDLAKKFSQEVTDNEAVSFYGVFDGHGGKAAAQFVRDHLPRVIVEDADFPLELEKVVTKSFIETDAAFANSSSNESSLASGTTALTAMIFGRSLLVANAGDCRAVLSRQGIALEMSEDHRPCSFGERARIESLGGYVEDGYLNGQLGVTRALGDWHLEGLKQTGGPLTAEPELKLIKLAKEDEFLIIGSDGLWDVFSSQNAIDFARRRLQAHNDVKLCCKEIVEEAIKRGAADNLTAVMVCFHTEPPPSMTVQRPRVRRSISAEGLQNLRIFLEG